MNPNGLTHGVREAFLSCAPPLLNGALFDDYRSVSAKKATMIREEDTITVALPVLSKYLPKYAGTMTDPALRRTFAEVFRKGLTALTAEDYREVRHIRFEAVDFSLLHMDVTLGDNSEKQISIVSSGEGIALGGNSSQVFPNLETLDVSEQHSLLQVTLSSQKYVNTLANLRQLRCLYLPSQGKYPGSPVGLTHLVANPGTMGELGGATLYTTAGVEELIQKLPNLKRLRTMKRESGTTLSGLQGLEEFKALYMPPRYTGDENLLFLTGVWEMELITSKGNEDIRRLRFLSGLTEFESLTICDVVLLLNLNDIKPLTKLQELCLSNATQLMSLEPLRELTVLETLDLGSSLSLSDYAALCRLPRLKQLGISDGRQAGCFVPGIALLPVLEKLECGAEILPQLVRCRRLKKLALFLGYIGSEIDFSGLSRLSEPEELAPNVENATQNTERLNASRELLKLRKVTFSYGRGTLLLHAFPVITEPITLSETMGMGGGSSGLRILTATGEDVPALEKFSVFVFDAVRFEGCHSVALREFCLGSCGIDSFAFTKVFPSPELLSISDDRAEDIAPLMALPKPRYLCYTDSIIRDIRLLKDRGIVPTE